MQWLVTSWPFIICLNLVTHRLSHKVLIFLIVTSVVYFVSRHRCCFCSSVVYFLSATNFVDKVMALQWEYNNIRNTLPCHTSGPSSPIFSCPKLPSFSCFKAFLWWCHWASSFTMCHSLSSYCGAGQTAVLHSVYPLPLQFYKPLWYISSHPSLLSEQSQPFYPLLKRQLPLLWTPMSIVVLFSFWELNQWTNGLRTMK